jgi:hypothetical protein
MSKSLGKIFLPAGSGTTVGKFEFIIDSSVVEKVEVGTNVTAETSEGKVIGTVIDMRTVGTDSDPVATNLAGDRIAHIPEVIVAQVQVFHSDYMRPVTSGFVREASVQEIELATGANRISWKIPAGVVKLLNGDYAPIFLDGHALLGPESAHLTVGGLSGQAAKTSYIGFLLASALNATKNDEKIAALVFNVKGEDLIYLDQEPEQGFELTDEDSAIYDTAGVPAKPFENVTVYAPKEVAGGAGTSSPRGDALPLGWDLEMVWPYLRYFLGNSIYEDEKLASFLADFRNIVIKNPDPRVRVKTFEQMNAWFNEVLRKAEEDGSSVAWNKHHRATMWRAYRMLSGIVPRTSGLVVPGEAKPSWDVPVANWNNKEIVVVDLAGLTVDVQAFVMARIIERVMKSAEDGALGVDHVVIVADELNSFAPQVGSEMSLIRKILQKVSTQGRYAGVSLWGAGQKLSKVDDLVRDNAATRALGVTPDGELASGIYGKMPSGVSERIATLPKGFMALSHYCFRSNLLIKFPRPAWRTGRAKTSGNRRKDLSEITGLTSKSAERLKEGLSSEMVSDILAKSSTQEEAVASLSKLREPDMHKTALHEPTGFDKENPFDLD